MLIQAYVTASILSRQVDADVTKGHSPGYLGGSMMMYFPAQFMYWYKRCLENKRRDLWESFKRDLQDRSSGESFRRKMPEMPFSVIMV